MVNLWPGRWVKFNGKFDGAHHARDGRVVGIFTISSGVCPTCQGRSCTRCQQGFVPKRPYIAIVDQNGDNLTSIVEGQICEAKIFLDNQSPPAGLEGIIDRQDIPLARLFNVPDDWQPRKE